MPGASSGRPETPLQLSARSGVHMAAAAHHTERLPLPASVQLGLQHKQSPPFPFVPRDATRIRMRRPRLPPRREASAIHGLKVQIPSKVEEVV